MRKRAAWLTHIQHTPSQYNLPEIGKKIADQVNRTGGAERFPDPAVQNSMAVALALLDRDDPLLRDKERALLKTTTPHDTHTLASFGSPLASARC
jgi:hypothetical protein